MPTTLKTDTATVTAPFNPFTNLAFAKLALGTNKAFPGKLTEKQVQDAKATVELKTMLAQRASHQKVMAQLSRLARRDHEFSHTAFENKSSNIAYAQFTYDQGLYYVPLDRDRPDYSKADLAHLLQNYEKTEKLFTQTLNKLEFLACEKNAEQKKQESQGAVKKVLHRTFRKAEDVGRERQYRALNKTLTSKAAVIAAYRRIQESMIDVCSRSNELKVTDTKEQLNEARRVHEVDLLYNKVLDAQEQFNEALRVYEVDVLYENGVRGKDLIRHPDGPNS